MQLFRLIKEESYTRGTILSVIFNIISKGILFLLTIIIARYFGSNIKTDIYFFVFASMILFSGFVNCIDTAVLIPQSMRIREQEGEEKSAAFLNYFLLIYIVIGIAFTAVMYFFGTRLFGLISKFGEADIETYRQYFWVGSFFFIFHVLTNYLNNILTSLKFFSLPMVISSFKSVIAIACIFLLKEDYDVLAVFLAGLISYATNLVIQLIVLVKVAGWKFSFRASPIPRLVWSNAFFAELGQLTTVASSLFPLYLLSGFGSGIISVMNYGKNIADIPNTLVTTQFANVSGIKLNEQVARQDTAGMNDTFLRTSKLMVFLLVPMGFFCFVFARPVIELFYRGGSFDETAVTKSAVFLKLLAVTVFSIGINAIVTRVFIAVQAIREAFFYQLILNVLLIAAISICTTYYGAYGYPYAVIIINLLNCLAMYLICKMLVPAIEYGNLLIHTGIVILLNSAIAAGMYVALSYIVLDNLLTVPLGFLVYLFILLFLNKKFNINTTLVELYHHAKKKFF